MLLIRVEKVRFSIVVLCLQFGQRFKPDESESRRLNGFDSLHVVSVQRDFFPTKRVKMPDIRIEELLSRLSDDLVHLL